MWNSVQLIISGATLFDWLLLITAILLLLYIIGTRNYDYYSRLGFPSTKPVVPFVGDMLPFVLNLYSLPEFVKKFYKAMEGHGLFGTFEFQKPCFAVRDPEMTKLIFIKHFDHFTNHRSLIPENVDPISIRNLFNLKDDEWRDMRATLSPAFTTSKIKGMFPLLSQCAKQMTEHLNEKYMKHEGRTNGLETDMKDLFTRLANDVIASVAFGVQCDSLKEPLNEFHAMGKQLTSFSMWRVSGYFVCPKIMELLRIPFLNSEAISYFDSLVRETIAERKKNNIYRPDVLQLLMETQEGKLKVEKEDEHESENIGSAHRKISNVDVSAQAIFFFFAGFETVSIALCFTAYAISHHSEVQRRLQQEVDAVWEKTQGNPTYEDVQGMKYLDSVINEALRMYPPVVFVERECSKDINLPATDTTPAVRVQKGQMMSVPVWGVHYDPEFWLHPERFDPDRFNDNKHSVKQLTHVPFGIGPRLCVGQRFALIEVKLGLLYLIRNFHLQPSPKTKHPMEYEKGFNLSIKGGFWSYLTPRHTT